jgi:ribosomal protein L37AE/L43A
MDGSPYDVAEIGAQLAEAYRHGQGARQVRVLQARLRIGETELVIRQLLGDVDVTELEAQYLVSVVLSTTIRQRLDAEAADPEAPSRVLVRAVQDAPPRCDAGHEKTRSPDGAWRCKTCKAEQMATVRDAAHSLGLSVADYAIEHGWSVAAAEWVLAGGDPAAVPEKAPPVCALGHTKVRTKDGKHWACPPCRRAKQRLVMLAAHALDMSTLAYARAYGRSVTRAEQVLLGAELAECHTVSSLAR